MLQTQTVEPNTFSLLKRLIQKPELNEFSLVGGTALSLLYGHRISIDLDLFTETPFSNEVIISCLKEEFKDQFQLIRSTNKFGIFCFIEKVKVDIIKHAHPLIRNVETIDGIRMYSVPDIAAMKINAILGRGKKKDFWDLHELLKYYTLREISDFYEQKFAEQRLLISIPQAVTYFVDAEDSEDPVSLHSQTWMNVKKNIKKKVSDYLK